MRTNWRDFPDVVLINSKTSVAEHASFLDAKSGDIKAAIALTGHYVDADNIEDIKKLIDGKAVEFLPVLAEEQLGRNKIPLALAELLAHQLDSTVNGSVVQVSRALRTESDGYYRLVKRVKFAGVVTIGANYILVDDAVTQGGTLADFRSFIEQNGGIVIGAISLMGKLHSAILKLTKSTLGQLRKLAGKEMEDWWYEQFEYDFAKLTESEARYICKQINRIGIDSVRAKLAKARYEAGC